MPSEAESLLASALLKIRSESFSHDAGQTSKSAVINKEPKNKSKSPTFRAKQNTLPTMGRQYVPRQSQQALSSGGMAALQAGAASVTFSASSSAFPLPKVFARAPRASSSEPAPHDSLSSSVEDSSEASTDAPATFIRRDKVEAALRSKPQRGRKRDNLSEQERLELTRTRNREHAKTTRSRKKARHQELLNSEKKLQLYEKENEVSEQRRQNVLEFLRIREQMIRSRAESDESNKKAECAGSSKVGSVPLTLKRLEDIVENIDDFTFHDGRKPTETASAFSRMEQFDEMMVTRVTSKLEMSVVPLLSLSVDGSSKDIALSANHSGFAQVNLSLPAQPSGYLISIIFRFHFSPNSDKLRSVTWTTVDDALDNTSFEKLSAQISYPSVVSLDPAAVEQDASPSKVSSKDPANAWQNATVGEKNSRDKAREEAGPGIGICI